MFVGLVCWYVVYCCVFCGFCLSSLLWFMVVVWVCGFGLIGGGGG